MKLQYYIATRFFTQNYSDLKDLTHFDEVVTLDSLICKMKFFDDETNEYIGIMDEYESIEKFLINDCEQIIRFCEVQENLNFTFTDDDFQFCGYDIWDCFEDNSWITNYSIDYSFYDISYTEFGLIEDYEGICKWIELNIQENYELKDGDFSICAVWRKVL